MRNIKRTVASITTVIALSLSSPSMAGGVPTFDAAAIARMAQQLIALGRIEGVNVEQVQALAEQIVIAENQFTAITGIRESIAAMFEGDVTAEKISLTLASLRRLDGISDNLAEQFSAIDERFEFIDGQTLYEAEEATARTDVYDLRSTAVKSEIVVSDKLFQDAGTAFERYEAYRTQLGSEDGNADLKAALDLNTRVQIENGQNIARLLQMLTVSAQSRAVEDAARIRSRSVNRRAIRFEPPEEAEETN